MVPAPFAPATGDITVRANHLTVEDSSIFALTGTDADGGLIDIDLGGDLTIRETDGQAGLFGGSGLIRDTGQTFIAFGNGQVFEFPVLVPYLGSGNAGDVRVRAHDITLEDGGSIDMETNLDGNAGAIDLLAWEEIVLSGTNSTDGSPSGLFSDAFSSGNAGSVRLLSSRLIMKDGARIDVRTRQGGLGGDIDIGAIHIDLEDSVITARSDGPGDAGSIRIGGIPEDTLHPAAGTPLDEIELDDSAITTEAIQAFGGNIDIEAETLLALVESVVSTNVGTGVGNGGNITIGQPFFVVLDNSAITVQADVGNGGNIAIRSEFFVASQSLVSASSNAGVDGRIEISAIDSELTRTVGELPAPALDATRLLAARCASRMEEQTGSFVVGGRDGVPPPPDGYLPTSGPVDAAEQPAADGVELDQWIVGGELALVGRCSS